MKYNLQHFSEIMETQLTEDAKEVAQQIDRLYAKLTSDLPRDVTSPQIQSTVHSLILMIQENGGAVSLDKPYIHVLIEAYSSDYVKKITDTKYGKGASDYIVKSFRYYCEKNCS